MLIKTSLIFDGFVKSPFLLFFVIPAKVAAADFHGSDLILDFFKKIIFDFY